MLQRSVMDNMWLGRYPAKGFVDQNKMLKDTQAIFDELDIDIDPREKSPQSVRLANADDRNRQGVFL